MSRRRVLIPVGTRFNRLVILESFPNQADKGRTACRVRCDCGNEHVVRSGDLKNGNTESCGCLHVEHARKLNLSHGMTGTPEYESWSGMIDRCLDPNEAVFKHYGGRGISVCDRWLNSFENFYADMGPKGTAASIDRIDNDGNYEPRNCRWASRAQQARNRRNNHLITIRGRTQCVTDWAREAGVSLGTALTRLKRGQNPEAAIFGVPAK